ncbi:hypothetical protein RchiOBHm_Chr1g0358311 [Rosa chinensis]|uniref:Uncharacterized protein n=1 Tax=Rosa chinensis TaxID=74649 RepID=A0A2P6SI66_ROSCH|nr:hypothetical protein RchiOBHm_Chr1g0358311 [Rosa chinensis]
MRVKLPVNPSHVFWLQAFLLTIRYSIAWNQNSFSHPMAPHTRLLNNEQNCAQMSSNEVVVGECLVYGLLL